ncbi:MAG TPA: hypothetical protein VK081_08680, partial [Planctomycetota bacterium]|nr:hypothetical protein [Planctomycetota bacterium]
RVIWQVSEDAALAAHVFTSNSFANEYLAKCDLGVQPFHPKPPGCSELGYFERDVPGAATTGNYLFVAKAGDPVLADLSGDRSQLASVQTYRFVVYIPVHGPNQTVDLARWVSVKIARLNDIERVTDPVKRTLLGQALYDEGVSIAWEPGRPIATGLRVINPSGSLSAFTPGTRVPGEPDQVRPAMFTPSRMALAQNGTLSSIPVPAFAIAGGGFPGGFEVKVDGNASGRMILVRLVVTSRLFDGNRSALVFTRTMSNRGTM